MLQWTDEEDVVRRANDTDMGLGASVWTRDLAQADRISKQLQAGTVWVNDHLEFRPDAAFGGHKYSGLGSELGISGLKGYCNVQTINQKKNQVRLRSRLDTICPRLFLPVAWRTHVALLRVRCYKYFLFPLPEFFCVQY